MKKLRIILEVLFFVGVTLLFLDITGTIHPYLGWMAKVQFLPAVLALNVGVIIGLLILTLLFGRVYCSVICPLGVFQDIAAWFGKKVKRNRYHYRKPRLWVRYIVLAVFIILMVAGVNSIALLIAPYSAWGRIVSSVLHPSWPTLIVAVVTFVGLFVWAWYMGRTYCNTICPVGTVLGILSRFSLFRPVINTDKCNGCGRCAKNCKASCIDPKAHKIDPSRCVTCFDCLEECKQGAISYRVAKFQSSKVTELHSRRNFITGLALLGGTVAVQAQRKKTDGGLAVLLDKQVPARKTHIEPAGAISLKHFAQHCTACQLCVSACPEGVLRPSTDLTRLMQPELSFERGYCRINCTKCADACPAGGKLTGAITKITTAEKTDIHIGRAVVIKENCISANGTDSCGLCARKCPTRAITMVNGLPAVNENLCIGCGKCEYLCPARPFSAIYVEGLEVHHN